MIRAEIENKSYRNMKKTKCCFFFKKKLIGLY